MYRILKAVDEHWGSDIGPNFAPCKTVDVIKDSLKLLSAPEKPVPLHAGAIKYYQEKGFQIPKKLLPPEKEADKKYSQTRMGGKRLLPAHIK